MDDAEDRGLVRFCTDLKTPVRVPLDSLNSPKRVKYNHRGMDKDGDDDSRDSRDSPVFEATSATKDAQFAHLRTSLALVKGELGTEGWNNVVMHRFDTALPRPVNEARIPSSSRGLRTLRRIKGPASTAWKWLSALCGRVLASPLQGHTASVAKGSRWRMGSTLSNDRGFFTRGGGYHVVHT